jgi:hypothetical protein
MTERYINICIFFFFFFFFIIHTTIESSQGLALLAGSLNYILDCDTYLIILNIEFI